MVYNLTLRHCEEGEAKICVQEITNIYPRRGHLKKIYFGLLRHSLSSFLAMTYTILKIKTGFLTLCCWVSKPNLLHAFRRSTEQLKNLLFILSII